MFDGWGDQVKRIIRYARWAWIRYVPPKTGFLNIPKLDDLPYEPHNKPMKID